jgi:hypothetical protein
VTYLDHGGVEVALFIYEKDVERLVSVADAMPAIAEVFRLSGADETKKRKKKRSRHRSRSLQCLKGSAHRARLRFSFAKRADSELTQAGWKP